jgi:hypothetical protein
VDIFRECCTRLLFQEYDKNVQELNDAQPDHMDEGPDGVIDISDDDSTTALPEANFPSERKEAQLLSNQQKISELSKCNGEYQERLQTLSDVFEKASAPDRSAEVGFVL